MAKRAQSVSRKIYFYRLERAEEFAPLLPGEMSRLANLPWSDKGRYLINGEGDRLAIWPDSVEYPIRLKFGRTRLSQLPTLEKGGQISPLEIEDDAGLLEACHVIIYQDGYVAAEFNFDGPRIKALGEYLFAKRNELQEKPVFRPLFQRDIVELVERMTTVQLLELRGEPYADGILGEADRDLAAAYSTIRDLGANKSVGLRLSAEQRPDSRLRQLAKRLVRLVALKPGDVREKVKVLQLKGFTAEGRADEVDMLEDHLIATRTIERQTKKSKAVLSSAAYAAIDDAYKQHRNEFSKAVIGRTFAP